ncbi:WD40 repeat domain-containing protein [Xanthobacteraceae bacterium Astr-EGSB]|uniref:WD40 repeat domain-containing protein n=1 Tax=Astrobacterium formosum TaxID=3069710 RepID=UPI0027B4E846|nr:WD40 repeat domain-containing protein [Xanthobacteraceae bacterium Astr-EGSB]
MSDTRSEVASIVERIRPVAVEAAVTAVHFLGTEAAFVLGEEAVLIAGEAGERRVNAHQGAILCSAGDGARIVTGGDDGSIGVVDGAGEARTIAADAKKRWIDRVATARDGTVAWAAGKQAFVRTPKGAEKSLDLPSSAGGLAFAPKGFRLAVAHYNGVTLWFPNASAKAETLAWKGSHLDVSFSPDGRFLITAMQEPALHGWRLTDAKDMRMSGYAGKVQSISWSGTGGWLATSGAPQLILWPFQGKDGPMGKAPKMLAPADNRVSAVACHPQQDIVAVGYENGMMLLVRIDDGAEIIARHPGKAPISALTWSASGDRLAFGTEEAEAGIITL